MNYKNKNKIISNMINYFFKKIIKLKNYKIKSKILKFKIFIKICYLKLQITKFKNYNMR